MNRFYGKVGYGESQESPTGSGVWVDTITEYPYFGDIIRKSRLLDRTENLNDNVSVGNSISIVADEYANSNFSAIRYVIWNNTAWTVSEVEVRAPRLILQLGKVYNGPFPESEEEAP